jgi:2,4-dienoyl-CoA reductase-like NADH-dependent reductase (Old Yellow Enzyme family)
LGFYFNKVFLRRKGEIMPALFDPLTIKDITLKNRIGVSPMCQYSYEDGFSNDWQLVHLGGRAAGGAGLVIAEATAVLAEGRISPNDVGLWKDEHIAPLAKVTRFLISQGAVPGVQIAHAGRKACVNRPWDGGKALEKIDPRWWQAVAPSPIAYSEDYQTPRELTLEEINQVKLAFKQSAARAVQAGFQWLEIHAAHGYLIHSFYSQLSNSRADQYGGSFVNRIRFLREVIQSVQSVWPERYPLTVRISGTDWTDGGWTIEDSVALAAYLRDDGVDLVDCSSGGNVSKATVPLSPGYQVPISEAVRNQARIFTAAVGLITTPQQADQIIQSGQADLVLMGREMLRNPYFAVNAAKELNVPAQVANQYLRAYRNL